MDELVREGELKTTDELDAIFLLVAALQLTTNQLSPLRLCVTAAVVLFSTRDAGCAKRGNRTDGALRNKGA